MSARFRKPRTILLTISAFTISFVVLLNVMLCQLTMTDISMETHQSSKLVETMKIGVLEDEFDNYYAKGRRKPKAANMKSPSEGYMYRDHEMKPREKSHRTSIENKIMKTDGGDQRNPALNINHNQRNPNNYSNTSLNDDNDEYNYSDEDDNIEIVGEDDEDDGEEDEDYDEYLDDNDSLQENPVFNIGDFNNISNNAFKKPPLRYRELDELSQQEGSVDVKSDIYKHRNKSRTGNSHEIFSNENRTVQPQVENGIFWSQEVEKIIPRGLSTSQMTKLVLKIRKQKVQYLHPPTWNKCGRPKNGYLILADGSSMCARYRDPHNKLVLGEVLSFYLSRMLGMDNVPSVILSKLNETSSQWTATDIHSLGWEAGKIIALIQWIPDLDLKESHVKMPPLMMEAYESQHPVTAEKVHNANLSPSELSELLQWGSMVIFDYLTANYDRVASMQDAADKEQKPGIIKEHIRNLRKSSKSGKLWLIDNESGLLDAYDLSYKGGPVGARFVKFHEQMLQTTCVFQRSLAEAVAKLQSSTAPHVTVEKYAREREPLLSSVPRDASYSLFQMKFSKRLQDVNNWIQTCHQNSQR